VHGTSGSYADLILGALHFTQQSMESTFILKRLEELQLTVMLRRHVLRHGHGRQANFDQHNDEHWPMDWKLKKGLMVISARMLKNYGPQKISHK